jgi:putative oxidoreductase
MMSANSTAISHGIEAENASQVALVLLGRLLFVLIFLNSGLGNFSKQTIAYGASHGVPLASLTVPAAGVLALAGGLSVLLGYRAKIGAWLIFIFLVPVTLTMHNFWDVADPAAWQTQFVMFMNNVSMLGGALLISQFGAGPFSLDARFAEANSKMK